MKRRDELIVGVTLLGAMAIIVGGALWLSEASLGQGGIFHQARFQTVGGLGVGNPVVLRGVRVGRIQSIELGEGDWVEATMLVNSDIVLPDHPAIIAASASLFGEWQATIINLDEAEIDDPNVRRSLQAAEAVGDDKWPGATLPDIGQLTAQAGRIASDIGAFSQRIETAFNDEAVLHLQGSIRDFGQVAGEISEFASQQTEILGQVTENVRVTSDVVTETAGLLQRIMGRIDSATAGGSLDTIVDNATAMAMELRVASEGFRQFMGMLNERSPAVERIIANTDSMMSELSQGSGTIARLVGDSTLYVEASQAIIEFRALLADIRENPRKYFKFSVF